MQSATTTWNIFGGPFLRRVILPSRIIRSIPISTSGSVTWKRKRGRKDEEGVAGVTGVQELQNGSLDLTAPKDGCQVQMGWTITRKSGCPSYPATPYRL